MTLTRSEYAVKKHGHPFNIYFISDIHYGQAGVDKQALNSAIKTIAEDDDGIVVLLGDMVDAILPLGDKRFNPAEIDAGFSIQDLEELPRIQADELLKILDPIKEKIIVTVSGNHEDKFTKYHGFNPAKYMARKLNIPDIKYMGFHSIIVRDGKHSEKLDLFLNHGDGGGGKMAGFAKNKIDDLSRYFDADIYAFAHIHKLETLHTTIIGLNANGTDIKRTSKLSICTGCFLRTYTEEENYFAHKGRRESDVGMIKVSVRYKNADRWERTITAEEIRY